MYNYKAAKKNIAELKRLLYVAITRAEEHLIISLSHKNKKYQKNSFAYFIAEALELDIEQEEIKLSDSLTYMKLIDNTYVNETIKEELSAKLISDIKEIETLSSTNKEQNEEYEILLDEIFAAEKNEIVSASKIALFLQCPRKYQLTYELGYFEVVKQYKDVSGRDDFNDKENIDEVNIGANIGGKIVHAVMEKNIAVENLNKEIDRLIEQENELQNIDDNYKQNLKEDILILLNHFYQTEVYNELQGYSDYKNELEIYIGKNDYFLYGIIDKLIIDEERIIIVDYKTDKIDSQNMDIKKESYFNQLMFYAYLLKDKYPNIKEFELWLVFIRGDNNKNVKVVSKKEIELFGSTIDQCVHDIRIKKFDKKTKGCEHCQYLLLNECR